MHLNLRTLLKTLWKLPGNAMEEMRSGSEFIRNTVKYLRRLGKSLEKMYGEG